MYGGTKTEMERLLADATAISNVKYDINSYADIVDAIHVIQTEMGITGTTAAEAAGTISGSISMAKSAWQDWLVSLADENADVTQATRNLVDSVATAAGNIVPRLGEIGSSLLDVLGDYTGELLLKGRDLTVNLGYGIRDGFSFVLSEIGRGIGDGLVRIRNSISEFIQAGKDIIAGLVQGIKASPVNPSDAMGEVASSMLQVSRDTLGIKSPSKKFMEVGRYSMEGMALGIKGRASEVFDAVGSVSKGALGAVSPATATAAAGAGAGGVTYNVYINGAQVNSDSAIESTFYNLMTELQRLGAMQGGR